MGNQSASSRAQFGRPALLGKEEGGTGRWFYFLEEKGGGGERGKRCNSTSVRQARFQSEDSQHSIVRKNYRLKSIAIGKKKKEGTAEESARFIRGVLYSPSSCVNVA